MNTTKILVLAAALVAPLSLVHAVTAGDTFLIDFSSTNGQTSGNWNNSYDPNYSITDLIDTTGASSSIDFNFTTNVAQQGNYDVTAGPSPFDVASAYEDAIYVGSGSTTTFRLSSLDTNYTYTLSFFGSRDNTSTRVTAYTVYQVDAVSGTTVTLATSGTDVGGSGVNHNISQTATVASFTPNASGEIYVDITVDQGTFGYLNAMSMTVIPEPGTYAAAIGAFIGALALLLRRRR